MGVKHLSERHDLRTATIEVNRRQYQRVFNVVLDDPAAGPRG